LYRILIVEDDQTIAQTLQKHLETWGHCARCVQDFHNVVAEFTDFDPQLMLLDITLPFFNGFHWCEEIRKISKIPIMFLSSASDNMNIIMAITQGGDDFIAKPFDLTVLAAKVQALLRRSYDFSGQSSLLRCRDAILNLSEATLLHGEEKIELTRNELKILQVLFENSGHVVSRETIMTALWETDCFVDDNTLTVNIARLRRKLDDIGLKELIATKKGIGYQI
jgi:two-component system response regulator protein BraR/BceR